MSISTENQNPGREPATTKLPPERGEESVVVIGNGPVGFRFVQQAVDHQLNGKFRLTVFGEESFPAYDRVNLTRLLDSNSPGDLQYEPRSWYDQNQITLHTSDPVVNVDREQRLVVSKSGRQVHYDRLIFATGSQPFIPPIEGIDRDGVFPYRTIDDLEQIQERAASSRRAVVLGGGLLGLEAADALKRLGVAVHVVEMAPVLMPRQLDNEGAGLLRRLIESRQIRILTARQTSRISQITEGLHVQFSDGESVVADMVVVSAGIRPRDELARECELNVGQRGGIVVDDNLRTSDPAIYAIGECAVHNGTVYGLVAPGFRMARTLVDRLRGMDAAFSGSNEATRLKLVGTNVFFSGDYLDPSETTMLAHEASDSYTKLIIRRNRLVGMIGVGEVPQQERLQEAIDQNRRVFRWQSRRFEREGRLWKAESTRGVASWPARAMICNCHNVTRGELTVAIERGCTTVESLAAATSATTSCGSCRSLVQQLSGQSKPVGRTSVADNLTATISIVAFLLIGLLTLAAPIALPISVQTTVTLWQSLITDTFWKQATGYSILGLIVLSIAITLRKRTRLLRRFRYSSIRTFHVALATISIAVLIGHTGFHRGHNLNFVLFSVFVGASATGAGVGFLAGIEHRLSPALRGLRRPLTWWHILCLWPLPLLIAFHIVSVYWQS